MNIVILLIQAFKLTLRAILKWTFSKLLASNVGGSGVAVAGDCRGQVDKNLVPWNVLEFH